MSAANRRGLALPFALALGVLGDSLLRAPGPPGLNVALMGIAGCSAVLVLRRGDLRGWNGALLMAALLFSFGLVGRDAEALRVFNLLIAMLTAVFAAGAGAWLTRAGLSEYVRLGVVNGFALLAGPVPLLSDGSRTGEVRRYRHVFAALRGLLIAAPLVLLFGSLLVQADPVFERLVGNTFAFDPAVLLEHAAVISVLSWGIAGYLGRWVKATSTPPTPLQLPRPQLGLVEGMVPLGLLNALFLAFVLVQLRYLFGGADLVEVTAGLTYADYARRGFFELLAVAALVIPVLLLADWSVHRGRPVEQWIFRGVASGQVLLLFAILASALYRMRLYRETYGLTEDRLLATWFMGWIAFVLAWLAVTVLQGRRQRFAAGAFAAGLVTLFALNVMNPHATIARVNAERSAAGVPYDAKYASTLSGDAVPELLATLDSLPAAERCLLADRLLKRWLPPRPGGWRTFNYGDSRARAAVRRERSRLEVLRCAPQPSPAPTTLRAAPTPVHS